MIIWYIVKTKAQLFSTPLHCVKELEKLTFTVTSLTSPQHVFNETPGQTEVRQEEEEVNNVLNKTTDKSKNTQLGHTNIAVSAVCK